MSNKAGRLINRRKTFLHLNGKVSPLTEKTTLFNILDCFSDQCALCPMAHLSTIVIRFIKHSTCQGGEGETTWSRGEIIDCQYYTSFHNCIPALTLVIINISRHFIKAIIQAQQINLTHFFMARWFVKGVNIKGSL